MLSSTDFLATDNLIRVKNVLTGISAMDSPLPDLLQCHACIAVFNFCEQHAMLPSQPFRWVL